MKERKFFNKVKELLIKSKAVKLAIFIVGFLVSWNFLVILPTENQFELYEQMVVAMSTLVGILFLIAYILIIDTIKKHNKKS